MRPTVSDLKYKRYNSLLVPTVPLPRCHYYGAITKTKAITFHCDLYVLRNCGSIYEHFEWYNCEGV